MATHHRFAVLVLTSLALATPAAGQSPPLADEFQVNSYTPSHQYAYGVRLGRDGTFVVTWDSKGQDLSDWASMARVFDETQSPITGELQVNTFTTGYQDYTHVGMDASGRFVVVWASEFQDGSSYGIFARRYERDGTPLSSEIPVNTHTTGSQTNPRVGVHPGGDFVVVWTSVGQDGSGAGVVGRRFDRTGTPLGGEFVVNTSTTGGQYADTVAVDPAGNFVVGWTQYGGAPNGIYARRYDAGGSPLDDPFPVHTTSTSNFYADAQTDRSGNFTIVWQGSQGGPAQIFARRYDSSGAALGDDFVASETTTNNQQDPWLAMDSAGNFLITWRGFDASGAGLFARRYDRFGTPVTDEFPLNATTSGGQYNSPCDLNDAGDFVAAWLSNGQDGSGYGVIARRAGLTAYAGAQVDAHAPSGVTSISDVNGVLEAGETVLVQPTWANRTDGDLAVTGSATDFSGPPDSTYTIDVSAADYGTIGTGGSSNCYDATGECYVVTISTPSARPSQHWDASLQEQLANGVPKTWPLHVGESFPDVPRGNIFYRFIETLFHSGVTGGCAGGGYCPANPVTRAQMAVFLLKSKFGSAHIPPPCTGTVFSDVPCTGGAFDPWIEELAGLGITGGCGGGLYCSGSTVTRQQMAVFLLKALEGSSFDPPDCAGTFDDVACTPGTGFSDWIEELANRGITGGCSASPPLYCPTNPNNRGQMAVFLVKTFGLLLYGA